MKITNISARVMRSFDYSHFEISLGATLDDGDDHVWCTDELRKSAARLADKAVAQYKIAKDNMAKIEADDRQRGYDSRDAQRIAELPETERSPEEQARLKEHNDRVFVASRRFDYEDDWQDDENPDE